MAGSHSVEASRWDLRMSRKGSSALKGPRLVAQRLKLGEAWQKQLTRFAPQPT